MPLFAGYDLRRGEGRLFEYDVTGGRYEEQNHVESGSGSLHAGTVVKLGFREGLTRDEAIDLVVHALYRAAEEDSATGGPDLVRGIFPVVATITADGLPAGRRRRAPHAGRGDRRPGGAHVMTMPFYVAPEQVMKDRADYARKGIARGRSAVAVLYTEGSSSPPRTAAPRCTR